MSTTYHTPHALRAPITSPGLNAPLGQLDAALSTVLATGSATATTVNGAGAASGQKVVPVASTTGFIVGDPIFLQNAAGTLEAHIIASISAGVSVTTTVNLAATFAAGSTVSKSPAELVMARGGQPTLPARLNLFDRWAYDVRKFGAVGDGVADDLAAIHAARDAAAAVGGGMIFAPDGTYKVSAQIALNVAQVGMCGVGPGSIIVTTANISVVKITAAQVQVSDFAIQMPVGGDVPTRQGVEFNTGAGLECAARRISISGGYHSVFVSNCSGVVVEGCRVTTYTHDGIVAAGNIDRISIIGNECYSGCTNIPVGSEIGGGILLTGANDCLIQGNFIRDNGTASPNGGAGIWGNGIFRCRIIGNFVTGNGKPAQDLNGHGIILAGSGGSKHNVVSGNYCAGNTAEGITLFQPGTQFNTVSGNVCKGNRLSQIEIWAAELNTISGNVCVDSVEGVGIMLNKGGETVGADYCTVVGNICQNNWQNGIQVTASHRVNLSGNQCIDNNRGASALAYEGSGISIDGSLEVLVNGNTCRDTSAGAKLQRYGLSIVNTSTAIGSGNNLAGNLTGEIDTPSLVSGIGHGYTELTEVSDPTAPVTNKARLYVRDNGGKSELVVRFPTGAIQQIKIEP